MNFHKKLRLIPYQTGPGSLGWLSSRLILLENLFVNPRHILLGIPTIKDNWLFRVSTLYKTPLFLVKNQVINVCSNK